VAGLAEIEQARTAAMSFNEELRGKLRVHTTLSVGQALIAPALIDFMAANPEISIDVEMSSIAVNPMEHQIDVAIRTKTARETSPGHVSIGRRILGRVRQVVVAAPDFLRRTEPLTGIEQIRERACLLYVTQSTYSEHWQFHNGRQDVSIKVEPILRSNNWLVIRDAAVAGLGIARLPDFAVRAEIESGRLVSLFEDQVRSDQQVQALFPKSQRMPAKMRLLLDFLAERLAADPAAPAPQPTSAPRSARSSQHGRRQVGDKRAGI
jgi:DNA-binding transcriptional LysR family regulator